MQSILARCKRERRRRRKKKAAHGMWDRNCGHTTGLGPRALATGSCNIIMTLRSRAFMGLVTLWCRWDHIGRERKHLCRRLASMLGRTDHAGEIRYHVVCGWLSEMASPSNTDWVRPCLSPYPPLKKKRLTNKKIKVRVIAYWADW